VTNAVSVLIVDDSALMRNIVSRMIESTPGLAVAERAMNGNFALQKIPRCDPDVIVLDLEMPEMNGIEFLRERKRLGIEIPVVILSSIARRGAEITMEALGLGANDFMMKPTGAASEDVKAVREQLTDMLFAYGAQYRAKRGRPVPRSVMDEFSKAKENDTDRKNGSSAPPLADGRVPAAENRSETQADDHVSAKLSLPGRPTARPAEAPAPRIPKRTGPVEIIAIGISTGGPNALREVFAKLDPDLRQPILVVQHMPAGFTAEFAKSLDRICPLEVKEAQEGDVIKPGRVLIAPGDHHLSIEKRPLATVARLSDDPPMNGHRPSADVLFASVAKEFGNRAMGVIMTGMGRDGAKELGTILREGGITIGQDEASSVVYGMPKVAWELGHVMEQIPLERMAERMCKLAKEQR